MASGEPIALSALFSLQRLTAIRKTKPRRQALNTLPKLSRASRRPPGSPPRAGALLTAPLTGGSPCRRHPPPAPSPGASACALRPLRRLRVLPPRAPAPPSGFGGGSGLTRRRGAVVAPATSAARAAPRGTMRRAPLGARRAPAVRAQRARRCGGARSGLPGGRRLAFSSSKLVE